MTIQPAQVDNLLPSYLLAGGLPSGSASFDDLILAIEDASPLIEPGDYDAVALTCKKAKRFNRMLLAFRFQIASQGSSLGLIVPGYVNLPGGNRFRTAVPA
ncbi:MAG TPA: hypothetical protein VKP13_13275, partial [Nitrospira sp.]|nr:hypothetical protein [Nitrospira sp.]